MQSKSKLKIRKRMSYSTREETGLLRIEERHGAGKMKRLWEAHGESGVVLGRPLAPTGKNKAWKTNPSAYGSQT